jgi:hypothetical protein
LFLCRDELQINWNTARGICDPLTGGTVNDTSGILEDRTRLEHSVWHSAEVCVSVDLYGIQLVRASM